MTPTQFWRDGVDGRDKPGHGDGVAMRPVKSLILPLNPAQIAVARSEMRLRANPRPWGVMFARGLRTM